MLFIRGNAIFGAPSTNGTNQFPKPPIMIGITSTPDDGRRKRTKHVE